jgi:hypothetical protein
MTKRIARNNLLFEESNVITSKAENNRVSTMNTAPKQENTVAIWDILLFVAGEWWLHPDH